MARKILLADDSVTAQNMGRKILVDAGYEVVTVNNGSAALKRIHESKPDLIVLDVYMPGYSGLEVCQRLKEAPETANIPILLTVGKLEPFKPDEARRARADAHVVKPFEASELLSVLARLEDRIVPSDPAKAGSKTAGGFFGGNGSAGANDPDTGWKSRLRFPARKKKDKEAEAEPDDVAASFRDFRRGKSKAAKGSAAGPAAVPPQEPDFVPDIPRDITPEELDALSALVEKLDAPTAAQRVGPTAETIDQEAQPASDLSAEGVAASADADAEVQVSPAAAASIAAEAAPEEPAGSEPVATQAMVSEPETSEPVTVESNREFEIPEAQSENSAYAVATSDISIPLPGGEPADQNNAIGEPVKGAFEQTEVAQAEVAQPEEAAAVNTARFAQEPAPIDQQDEPIFAVRPDSVPAASSEARVEAQINEAAAMASPPTQEEESVAAVQAPATEVAPIVAETKGGDEPAAGDAEPGVPAVEVSLESSTIAAPQLAGQEEAHEAEGPAPSDEELAEALRLLTPATGHSDIEMPSHASLVAAGQMLAEEAARNAAMTPRWIAEAVPLTADEAALSLEAEMFRNFANDGARETVPSPVVSQVSIVPEVIVTSPSEPPRAGFMPDSGPAQIPESTTAPTPLPEAQIPAVEAAKAEVLPQQDQHESYEASSQEFPQEPAPPATFADVALPEQAEPAWGTQRAEAEAEAAAPEAAAAPSETGGNSSLDVGGQEDMGKRGTRNSDNSGWHQIHEPAPVAAQEGAKQATSSAEEPPKAMAAAAAGENAPSSATAPAPDPNAIASIVDSVLADLRPKIVEEIAKKLAGK